MGQHPKSFNGSKRYGSSATLSSTVGSRHLASTSLLGRDIRGLLCRRQTSGLFRNPVQLRDIIMNLDVYYVNRKQQKERSQNVGCGGLDGLGNKDRPKAAEKARFLARIHRTLVGCMPDSRSSSECRKKRGFRAPESILEGNQRCERRYRQCELSSQRGANVQGKRTSLIPGQFHLEEIPNTLLWPVSRAPLGRKLRFYQRSL